MGLRSFLTRVAGSRAHVLIAEAPGAFRERVALERAMDQMGWQRAESVADADVLAVVGRPGAQLNSLVERTWAQLSEPRARIDAVEDSDVEVGLCAAREALIDRPKQARTAVERVGFTPGSAQEEDHHEHEKQEGHDEPEEHGESGSKEAGHDHGGHDHGGMSPDGIPLAEGAADRDGLEMDELHLPLGPVLAHWPAGLVLRLTLHGDIVADAEVEQLTGASAPPTSEDRSTSAARLLDAAASVLTLAGLPAEAAQARRLRNSCLDGEPVDTGAVERLGQRVQRHRALRWILTGIAGSDGHDMHDRLVSLFDRTQAELAGQETHQATNVSMPTVQTLPDLVAGQELAAVRLLLAAAAPDLANQALAAAAHE